MIIGCSAGKVGKMVLSRFNSLRDGKKLSSLPHLIEENRSNRQFDRSWLFHSFLWHMKQLLDREKKWDVETFDGTLLLRTELRRYARSDCSLGCERVDSRSGSFARFSIDPKKGSLVVAFDIIFVKDSISFFGDPIGTSLFEICTSFIHTDINTQRSWRRFRYESAPIAFPCSAFVQSTEVLSECIVEPECRDFCEYQHDW